METKNIIITIIILSMVSLVVFFIFSKRDLEIKKEDIVLDNIQESEQNDNIVIIEKEEQKIPEKINQPIIKTTPTIPTPVTPPVIPAVVIPVTPPLPPSPLAIQISNFSFSPQSVTIKKGTTITWTNKDGAPHTVTAQDGTFNSGTLSNADKYSFTFQTVGEYNYVCNFHSSMQGKIIVTN